MLDKLTNEKTPHHSNFYLFIMIFQDKTMTQHM